MEEKIVLKEWKPLEDAIKDHDEYTNKLKEMVKKYGYWYPSKGLEQYPDYCTKEKSWEAEELRKKILNYISFLELENNGEIMDDSYIGRFNQGAMFALYTMYKYVEEA